LSFSLAVTRKFASQGEERKTDFFRCTAWRKNADFISKYFSKGKLILVDGELQTREYDDKNGVTVRTVEILVDSAGFTGEKKGDSQTVAPAVNTAYSATPVQQELSVVSREYDDNDYPF
jgi:single-strand DNA-binding protein